MEYKIVLGILASVIGFVGYFPYIRDTLKGKTKPHAFSWLVWGLLEATAFFAQVSKGGGAGAWVTGFSAVIAFFVAGVALVRKDTEIKTLDWVALLGGLAGIVLWQLAHNPLLAVVSVAVADALAFIPTFRKSYNKPEQETLIEYALSVMKWVISLFALQSYSPTTWLYPASLVVTNGVFVIVVLIRRKRLRYE